MRYRGSVRMVLTVSVVLVLLRRLVIFFLLVAAFLTQTVGLEDGLTVKFEIWDTAGQGKCLNSAADAAS